MTEATTPHQESDKTQEEIGIGVEELVNKIAHSGPGSSADVIVHFPDGVTRQGRTVWTTELAGHGPAVVFDDPERPGSYKGVLPLGGQTVYNHPPRDYTSYGARKAHSLATEINFVNSTHTIPHNPTAKRCRFEIVPKEKPTKE